MEMAQMYLHLIYEMEWMKWQDLKLELKVWLIDWWKKYVRLKDWWKKYVWLIDGWKKYVWLVDEILYVWLIDWWVI